MLPEVNDKGEFTEVQVLEEFDPDQFLDRLKKQDHTCLCCWVPMKFGSVQTPNGSTWEYYRCPSFRFFTKCYVTCGAREVSTYLQRVAEQTHPCFKKIDPARFRCQCNKSLVLVTSHSANNPDRLYLKCPKCTCKFFQCIDEAPRGLDITFRCPSVSDSNGSEMFRTRNIPLNGKMSYDLWEVSLPSSIQCSCEQTGLH